MKTFRQYQTRRVFCTYPHGFTLIELLIAIGIIGVLIAIAFPVFQNARAKAHQATCTSNLRQIGAAMSQYVSDFDGCYPPSSTGVFNVTHEEGIRTTYAPVGESLAWSELLEPYLKSFPRCPVLSGTMDGKSIPIDSTTAGYTLNENISQWKPLTQQTQQKGVASESTLSAVSLIVIVFDARSYLRELDHPDQSNYDGVLYGVSGLEGQADGAIRHQGGANYLFADNHVKWYRPRQLAVTKQSDNKTPGFGL